MLEKELESNRDESARVREKGREKRGRSFGAIASRASFCFREAWFRRENGGQVRGQPGRAPQKLAYLRECPRRQKNAMVPIKCTFINGSENFHLCPFFKRHLPKNSPF